MLKKLLVYGLSLVFILGLAALLGKPYVDAWMMSVPTTSFDQTAKPEAPDYSLQDSWAALPTRSDSADWVPEGSGFSDGQAEAKVDVFFVYPTAAFYGDYWVASLDNLLHRVSVDYGILPQHVSAFNGVGRIYAPRYRSVRMPIWWAEDKDSVKKATALAYSDVKSAFEHYLQNWNNGRPIIFVSHSQGTLHLIRLLREKVDGKPLSKRMVAAYLIGNTIPDVPWFQQTPLCKHGWETGCYVTWNTILDGGDSFHWVGEKGLEKIDCVNPLSWKADTIAVSKEENKGSLPMVGAGVLLGKIGPLQQAVVGARCDEQGVLRIRHKPSVPGYTAALFEGGSYHTYDLNFYYHSIRENAALRVDKFFEKPAPESSAADDSQEKPRKKRYGKQESSY